MIRKRGRRYGVRIYRNGRQEWLGTYATLREAREVEREALAAPKIGRHETCDHFAERWTRDYPRPKDSTNAERDRQIRRFARDFRGVRMADVDRATARAWALEHRSNVPAVRAMFTDAVRDGIAAHNPFTQLGLRASRGRKDLVALTEAELVELADKALEVHGDYGTTMRAIVLFAGYVGIRPGELFGLQWDDLDLRTGEARIARAIVNGRETTPKNGKARTVIVPPPALEALRRMPRRVDTEHVFTSVTGRRLSKGSLLWAWKEVRAAAGRNGMDFYELRHCCATLLLERGVSHADVAIQLGHTDGGALVMSTYGHPSEELARERLKRAFGENVAPIRAVRGRAESA
jgi:integrase